MGEEDLFGSGSEDQGSPRSEQSPYTSDNDYEREPKRLKIKETSLPRYGPSHQSKHVFFTRVPAFIAVDPQRFDAETAVESLAADQDFDENTVRWKYAKTADGEVAKVSNARIVEWSDGSRTLQVGSEQFDIRTQKPYEPLFITKNHLAERMLQTAMVVDETLTLLPTSTTSATHKRLAAWLASKQQSNRVKVGIMATEEDPERIQRDVEKAESMKERARRKLESQRQTLDGRQSKYSYAAGAQFDEDEEEEEEHEEEEEEARETDEEALDSDELEALDDEADEANATRLRAVKETGDDDAPLRRTRVLEDSDDEAE
ncbi:RNA polymerase-associated protein LEO1 [Wickerhamiella sorbophila]|uniref:RNA polymerase-associated protein LEO1 n=1 Tax=Wickerhamiella sorbophila TaxID=45607 RepID=A0A2T0FIQ9_9ASCO|nr:RNA polymerase-associated protein LEO1 [Wickerhamiella sorbophila]PRT54870.1 RNA polymerase-associated protein LEO1 [Wickerhamiella sorbophila]